MMISSDEFVNNAILSSRLKVCLGYLAKFLNILVGSHELNLIR